MSAEESVRPVVEKGLLKEALSELLDEMPAFREWRKGMKPSNGQGAGPSDAAGSSRPSGPGETEPALERTGTTAADRSGECV